MDVVIKSKNYPNIPAKILKNILINDIIDLSNCVEKIIVCDDEDLENEIQLWDKKITITKLIGCTVKGKTILYSDKSIIFITVDIILNLYGNITVQKDEKIDFNNESLKALKTIYHEIGHAKRNKDYGRPVTKKVTNTYVETLNELWKILREEYYAEMYVAKLIKFNNLIEWYGDFNDEVESVNYISYLNGYQDNGLKLNGNIALQLMHQYYFVPLFQKAGFLEEAAKLLSLKDIELCQTIQEIQNCKVIENDFVPVKFNELILRKWDDFNIPDKLDE